MNGITYIPCNKSNYNVGRMGIDYIIVHYTANDGSALNNCIYFGRETGLNASAHYFVDSNSIYQSVLDLDTAWHCGNSWMNANSIGIEVVSAGEDFTAGEIENLSWLVQGLMAEYNVSPENVFRHYDTVDRAPAYTYTEDPYKLCPAPYINDIKWKALWYEITGQMVRRDTEMVCLFRPDGESCMVYYDGVFCHDLDNPDEMEAIKRMYRECNGKEIPCFEFGTPDEPWAHRFFDAISHGHGFLPHM